MHFCKKYDICSRNWSTSGCTFGKISLINNTPHIILSVSPKVHIEVTPFQLRLPIRGVKILNTFADKIIGRARSWGLLPDFSLSPRRSIRFPRGFLFLSQAWKLILGFLFILIRQSNGLRFWSYLPIVNYIRRNDMIVKFLVLSVSIIYAVIVALYYSSWR